jgi:hypothetical protein
MMSALLYRGCAVYVVYVEAVSEGQLAGEQITFVRWCLDRQASMSHSVGTDEALPRTSKIRNHLLDNFLCYRQIIMVN